MIRVALLAIAAGAGLLAWLAGQQSGQQATPTTEDEPMPPTPESRPRGNAMSAAQVLEAYRDADPEQYLPPEELLAFCWVESGFNPSAYRYEPRLGVASYGLMQVLSTTAKDALGLLDPSAMYDPATGIRAGLEALKMLRRDAEHRLGRPLTEEEAVGCYNAGGRAVAEGRIPTAYVERWRRARERFAVMA